MSTKYYITDAMTIFGHWHTWGLIFLAWFSLGALTAITVSLIACVGAWRGRGNKP